MTYQNIPVGTIVYSIPVLQVQKRYGGKTWELARLWIDDQIPSNGESWFIAKTIQWIKANRKEVIALVSYADHAQGHQGVIYRASNWIDDGVTKGRDKDG